MLRRNIHILKALLLILILYKVNMSQSVAIRLGQIEQNPNTHEWALYVYADVFDQNDILVPNNQAKSYYGVFLDQAYDEPGKPHYSVKAEEQRTFKAHDEDITDYSLGWEGTDVDFQHADQPETPVVFHAANAEARAVYKGHLASSVARATGYNNGRRLCKTVV